MLIAGNYMGQELVVPVECRGEGISEEDTLLEAAFDLSYDIAHGLECVAHFFHVRLTRDEHDIMWTVSKCLELRRFAEMPGEPDDQGYEDIYEPLEGFWIWMVKSGVRDVPGVDVMYNEALLSAEAMQKDIPYYYRNNMGVRRSYNNLSQMALPSSIWRTIRLFRDHYLERCLDNA